MDNEKPRRKLILHFDARNTLFLSDKSYRFTVEEALNSYITGIVWGKLNDESERNEDKTVQNHSSNCDSPTFAPMGSTSDHLINAVDVNNDNPSVKVAKIQVTNEISQNHSK
uniref:Hypotheticial protein n=1 Tax=Schistosoma japonicum TaxID=6182 RepID=C1LHW8_SCHJA|nr:hypotheticial protein [Schistosoma japonicum]